MAEISGALSQNITETSRIKTGGGKIYGVIVNSHTSGTLKLVDGLANGVAASGVLTSAGACVPASHATSKITSTGTNVSDGDTVTISNRVYTFKTTLGSTAYQVKIGADAAESLDNLKLAINGTGTPNTNYSFGTSANETVYATTNTDTTQVVVARTPGISANIAPTTTTAATLSWADTTLGGGTGDSDAGVTTAGATITIGDNTYTAVLQLSEASGASSVANQVLWVTSEAVFLDNLKSAVNGTGASGTDYSSATIPHPQVRATTNTNTEQTFVAREIGTGGNSIATTETLANYSFAAATLASGTLADGKVLLNTYTFASGSQSIFFPEPIVFENALLAVVAGTAADLTIVYN